MATLQKGTWWRESYDNGASAVFAMVTSAPTRTIFVGQDAGSPIIRTVDTADLGEISPTVTNRTPNGTDPLFSVDYASDVDETVAVGANGRIETSTDQGLNWTSQTVSLSPPLLDVVAVAGAASRFAAAGFNSVWVRDAGGIWSKNWSGGQAWYGITRKAIGGWVVVGQNGYAMQSATALGGSFGARYQISTTTFNKVRANGFWFMAVGQQGQVFRSVTGVSGSWADVSIPEPANLVAVASLDSSNKWVVFDSLGYSWYSPDNGSNWTKSTTRSLQYGASGVINAGAYALAVGPRADIYVSFDQVQEDYVPPGDIEIQAPPPAFDANDDMAGDAVRRLVDQFRSGRG